MSDDTACTDNRFFADRYPTKYSGIAADRRAAFDQRGDTGPIGRSLQLTCRRRRPRVPVIRKHDSMAHKDVIFNGHAFANKRVTTNLGSTTDLDAALDFYKCPNLCLIADLTSIQIHEGINLYISA